MSKTAAHDEVVSVADTRELGSLGVLHLKRLWSRGARRRMTMGGEDYSGDWLLDRLAINGLGLNIIETLNFIYSGSSFAEFEAWIAAKHDGRLDHIAIGRLNANLSRALGNEVDPLPLAPATGLDTVLNQADLAFWAENGYVVVPDAVSAAACEAAEKAIWAFLGARPEEPDDWYRDEHGHTIWVPLANHAALTENRKSARIRCAFAQLWGTADLSATVDRCGFNPPERPGWGFPGPHLHWDTSLYQPIPLGLQGILYLTDTAPDQGAFTCVPGFHHEIGRWLDCLPPDTNPRQQDLRLLGPKPVAGKAGDLVIWHHALPHGSSPNRASRPRIVQYISMFPVDYRDDRPWI